MHTCILRFSLIKPLVTIIITQQQQKTDCIHIQCTLNILPLFNQTYHHQISSKNFQKSCSLYATFSLYILPSSFVAKNIAWLLRANFPNYKGPGPQIQMSRKITVPT